MNVFVILHYLSEEMTVECVDNILKKFTQKESHVIIVDNASDNESGLHLQMKYGKNEQCTVIINDKNLGFACGNNIGFKYAKNNFDCDFVVVMNNDVLIEDMSFLDKIKNIYNETKFDVLGPDILSVSTGVHQNPMRIKPYSKDELEQIISERRKWLSHFGIHYAVLYSKAKIKSVIKKIIHYKSRKPEDVNPLYKENRIEDPVLHGACLIFSKRFIENENVVFNPNTFLYMEEDILQFTCAKKGYRMIYDSSLQVKHMEDVSTNLEFKSDYEKRKMKYKNLIKSANVLLKLMEEN